jgi:hypothetical protein
MDCRVKVGNDTAIRAAYPVRFPSWAAKGLPELA